MFERRPQPKEKDGCKIKVDRDKMGNIKKYESNGKCSTAEIQQFENSAPKDLREEDYD